MAQQAEKLRVAQLERNRRRKRWWHWTGDGRLSDARVNEVGAILPMPEYGTR